MRNINNKLVDNSTNLFMEEDGQLVPNNELFNIESLVPSTLIKSEADKLLEEKETEISQTQENQKDTTEINDDDFIKLEVAKSLQKMVERIENKNTSTDTLREFIHRNRDEEALKQNLLVNDNKESRLKTIELLSAIEASRLTLHKRYKDQIQEDIINNKEQYQERLDNTNYHYSKHDDEEKMIHRRDEINDVIIDKKEKLNEKVDVSINEVISKNFDYLQDDKLKELRDDYFAILLLEKERNIMNNVLAEFSKNKTNERFDDLLNKKIDEARQSNKNSEIADLEDYMTYYESLELGIKTIEKGVNKEFFLSQYDLGNDRPINEYAMYLAAKEKMLELEKDASKTQSVDRAMDEQDAAFYEYYIRDLKLPSKDINNSTQYLFNISRTLLGDKELKEIATKVDRDEFYKTFDKKLKELLKENYSKDEAFFGNLLARKNARTTIFESDASLIRGDYNKTEDDIDTSSIIKEAVENQVNSVLDNANIADRIPTDRATAEKIIKDAMEEYEKQVHLDRYSVDELAEAFKNTDYYKLFSALSKYERYDFIVDEEEKQNEEAVLKIVYDKVMDDDTITSLLNSEISEMLEEKIELAKENSSDLEKAELDIKNIPNLNNLSSDELAEAFTKTEYSKLFGALSLYEKPELFESISQESRNKILTEVYDEMMENDNITGLFNDEIATMIDEEIELFHEKNNEMIDKEIDLSNNKVSKEFVEKISDEFIIKDTIVDKQANNALKERFENEVAAAVLENEPAWRENLLNVVSSVDGIKENYFNTSKRQLNEANIDYAAALSQEDKNTIYTIADQRILEKIIKERQEHNIEVFAEIDGWSDKTYSNAINKNSNLASIMLDKKLPHGLGNNPADELSTFWFNTCSDWYINGTINRDEAKNIDIKEAVNLTYKKEKLTEDECGILSKFLAKNAIEFSENKPIKVDGDRNFVPSNALYKVAEGLNDLLKKQECKILSDFLVKNMNSVFKNSNDVPEYLINRDGSAIFTRTNYLHLKEANKGLSSVDKATLEHVSNYLNDRKLSGLENHRNEYETAFEICNKQVEEVLTKALKNIHSPDNFNDKLEKELKVLLRDYRMAHVEELLHYKPQDEFNRNYKEPTSLDEAEKRLAELTKYFSITDESGDTPLENARYRVFNMPNTPIEFSDYKNYFDIKHEVELKRLEYDALNEYKSKAQENVSEVNDEQKAKKAELNLVSLKASNEIYDIVMKSYNGDFVSSSEIKQIDSWLKENNEVIEVQATHGHAVRFGEGQILRSLDLDFVLEIAEPLVKDIEKENVSDDNMQEKLWAFREVYDTLEKFEKGEEVSANEVSEVKKWLSKNKELIETKVKDENNSHVRFIKDGTMLYVDTSVVIGLANALVKDKQVEIEKIKDSEVKVENSASETEKIKTSGNKKRKNSSDELGLNLEQMSINGYGLSAKEIERGKDYKSDGELVTGQISRVRRNIEALELSAKIQKENRFATKDEQKIMAGYTGWGGLTGVFGTANENLKAEAERLDKFLKENSANSIEYQQTYAAMSLSSQSAYYTSPLLIESIYKGLEQLGVADNGIAKKVLEPSCGVGNFMTNSQNSSFNFTGIEIEKASYNIAKQLNPNADIKNTGFERFKANGDFDIVVGNPPYDNDITIQDSTSLGDRLKIANYFPIKSMEQLRDGGIIAFVMPTGFLDKNSDGHLNKLVESGAEFLGAIRLPNTAFKNSGTEVNTDIVFFQKKTASRQEIKDLPILLNLNNMRELGERENEVIKKAFELKESKISEDDKIEKSFEIRSKEFYDNFSISNYFIQNPQNILGTLEVETNRFGEYVPVIKDDGRDLKAELEKFINTLPKDIYKDIDRSNEIDNKKKFDFITHSDSFEYIKGLKNGNYFYDYTNNSFAKKIDSESYLLVSENDIWKNTLSKNMLDKYESGNYDNKKRQKEVGILNEKLRDYIELRDTLNVVLSAELKDDINDEQLSKYRQNLNNTFDTIKSKYAQKEIKETFKNFSDDLSYYLVSNLESDGQKAKIFTERISTPISEPKVSNAKEALLASISMRGKIDLDYLDKALEQPLERTIKELKDDKLIFVEPKTNEFVVAEKYLSGNVKKKYKEVMDYIEKTGDKSFEANANALKEVFPPDRKIQDISFGMAQSWIPISVYEDFLDYYMKENDFKGADGRKPATIIRGYDGDIQFKRDYYSKTEERINKTPFYEHYLKGKNEKTSNTYISYDDFKKRTPRYINDSDGTRWENDKRIGLIDFALPYAFNNSKVAMMMADGYRTDENGETKIDRDGSPIINYRFHKELTDDVMATISNIQENFIRYVLTNEHQKNLVEQAFNDKINTDRVRDFKSNELDLKGSNPNIKLRPHQVAGVWRGVQEKTTLLNVNVGGGKTFMGVALSMEQKRMGIINKTAIVAPKHLVGSWEKEYKTLYPNANILVLDEKSFDKKNRARFLANVKLNDYDAVIMSKEQFQAIPKNPEKTLAKLAPEIEKYKKIESTTKSNSEKKAAREHIKKLEKYAQKARKLADDLGKDKMTTFEELGIDCLIVDEAHNYKNLNYMTKKKSVAGLGSQSGSDIAFDMKMVTDDFNESDNKKLYFLTGTPVANSLCEIYHMQSFLQPEWLEEKGLTNFDKWANTFAKDVSDVELGAGGEPKIVTRMSDFVNLQALSSGWGNINFYANNDDIEKSAGDKFIPRAEIIKVVAPRSPALNHYYGEPDEKGEYPQGSLMWRFAHINEKENHPLRLTNLARKAALDYRMIDDNPANDFENSKINMVVKNVIDNYHNNHADEKSTQIIFCDLSVSKTALKDIKIDDDTPKELQTETKEHHSDMVLKDKDGNVIQETYRITYLNGDVETYNINDFIEELKARNIELPKDLTKVKDLEEVKNGEFKMTGFAKVDVASENDKEALKGVTFDVYSDIAKKLMKSGIPRDQIAFIGDYTKKEDKDALFEKMRNGDVRILIGSTAKMGTGMNVQDRLVALHNVDYPWNPAGFEQRIGRIERQGNIFYEKDRNFKPKVYNYSTERTYDVKALQLLESKAKAIHKFQEAHKLGLDTLEDVSQNAISFAEMKALTAGNPLIFEEFNIGNKLSKLEKEYMFWDCNKLVTEKNIENKEEKINELKENIIKYKNLDEISKYADDDLNKRLGHLGNPKEIIFSPIYRDDSKYSWADNIDKDRLKGIIKAAKAKFNDTKNDILRYSSGKQAICIYRGIEIGVAFNVSKNTYGQNIHNLYLGNPNGRYNEKLVLPNVKLSTDYLSSDDFNLKYVMRKVDEALEKLPENIKKHGDSVENLGAELENSKKMLDSYKNEGFKEQKMLDALRSDKKEIVRHIKANNYEWIPSYKKLANGTKAENSGISKDSNVAENSNKEKDRE